MKLIKMGMVVIALLMAVGCERVAPGHVGIKVNYWGDDKGVDSYPVVTGMQVYNPFSTSILQYPTYMQNAEWKGDRTINFNDKDGLNMGSDVSLAYQVEASRVPKFYVQFRTEDLTEFTNGFMYNVARNAFSDIAQRYSAEQIYGQKKEEFLDAVLAKLNKETSQYGIVVSQFGVLGGMRLPDSVKIALESKVKATQDAQRVENELRTAQAEAAKKIAAAEGAAKERLIEAESTAEANRKINASLTDELIRWRTLTIQEKTLWRWDGKMPSTVVNGAVPLIAPGISK